MATLDPATQSPDRRARLTPRPLVVVGGGEHAAVVIDAARTNPDAWELRGFTDPNPGVGASDRLGLAYLGDDTAVSDRLAPEHAEASWFVLGFGAPPEGRRASVERFGRSMRWATVIHASAWVSPGAVLGEGTVVLAGATINAGARLGRHVIVNTRSVVEHDVRVGDFAHLAPGTIVGGGAAIGDDTFVGMGALVRDHVVVGARATVGMGAVVVGDIPDDTTIVGSPARVPPVSGHPEG